MDAWYEDEAFWREGYRFMFSDDAFREATMHVEQIMALTCIRNGPVLDLGCGPGRHAVPLAVEGFEVTGVDASPFLLGKANEYAAHSRVGVEFVRADMRTFRRPEEFELAVSMFGSFGYFETRAEDQRVLANLHDSLRPGGVALIDVTGKELTGRFWNSRITDVGDVTRVERHEIVEDWTRIRSEWMLIRDGDVRRFSYVVRIYSGQELRDMLQAVGFRDVLLYGDLEGAPYGPQAKRLVALARKN
jgi:SAM-dependent methyltransferase